MLTIRNFIDGKYVDPLSGEWMDCYEPGTGRVYARVAASDGSDIDTAVAAAKKAFPSWSATPVEVRAKYLFAIADILESRLDEFAEAESRDQGKTVTTAKTVDIPRAVSNFRFYAGHILHSEEMFTVLESPVKCMNYAIRRPYGVAGLISPWNLPLYLATWKIAPAIAVGNTCVLKPSELSPLTASMMGEVLTAAQLPPGVVNIVQGFGSKAGQALVDHKDVPLISFTGGTVTGKRLAATAGAQIKKLSLELGGKNANLIFEDCDFAACVATSLRSSFANQGEICLCGSRILVQRSIYDKFVATFVEETKKLKVGDRRDPSSFYSALISKEHLAKVRSYVELARSEGGTVLCGGAPPDDLPEALRGGYYLRPTVITGLTNASRCCQEEIFGPVVTIVPFDTEVEAIALANDSPYGLSATVWTRDLDRANRVSHSLHCGYVWVNCWLVRDLRVPFGGMKGSGVGREGGKYAVDFYSDVKTVCTKL